MQFSAADQAAMIASLSVSITIGTTSAVGVFAAAGKVVPMFDGSFSTTGPLLTLDTATAALVTENSTVITIGGVTYQATQKIPDGTGFFEFELTKDY